MVIWAFYLISCVKYEKDEKIIKKVGVHKDSEDGFGDLMFQKRDLIINNWKKGKSYMTLHIKPNGGFKPGEKIGVYTIDNKDYIKIIEDDKPEDNLGDIPGCKGVR